MLFTRNIYNDLIKWKTGKHRKPLILEGARQVGKTSIIKHFGASEFKDIAYFNFEEKPELKQNFENSKEISRVLNNLSIIHGKKILPEKTLIFFDEIQACNEALNALKYFNENAPEYAIIAAGSLLGITLGKKSFPVGNVEFLKLYPLTFHEFLKHKNEKIFAFSKTINSLEPILDIFFNEYIEIFKAYMISGGMPGAAKHMIDEIDIDEIQKSLDQIINAYTKDFAVHAGKNESIKLRYIWESIPSQLSKENKKFVYQVVKSGARAREYENALQWLKDAGLIYKTYLCKKPLLPIAAYINLAIFKIYMLDIGLLRKQSGLDPSIFNNGHPFFTEFKGAFTENYIIQSLVTQFEIMPYYWASDAEAEVDFLIQYKNEIIPIEVKSGENKRSKSLAYYSEQYKPNLRIRYSLKNLDFTDGLLSIPIFLADYTQKFVDLALAYKEKGVRKVRNKGDFKF